MFGEQLVSSHNDNLQSFNQRNLVIAFVHCSNRLSARMKVLASRKSTIPVDQALEDKITALMADMSLKEKVGQLIMAEIKAISPKDAKRNGVGGL